MSNGQPNGRRLSDLTRFRNRDYSLYRAESPPTGRLILDKRHTPEANPADASSLVAPRIRLPSCIAAIIFVTSAAGFSVETLEPSLYSCLNHHDLRQRASHERRRLHETRHEHTARNKPCPRIKPAFLKTTMDR
jgi:hypothetical protein